MHPRPKLVGYGIILLAAIGFGTYGVWSRLMGQSFDPFFQAWVRSLLILVMMLPFMVASKSFKKIERKDWFAVGIYIAFCVFTQVPLYYAFNHASIGVAQLIFYSTFVITAYVVGWLYLNERITRVKLLAMGLAFIGLTVIFGTSVVYFAPLGLLLAAINGIASGGEVSSSKKISSKYSPALLVFWGWFFTLATHLPISLLINEPQPLPQFDEAWLYLAIYAVVNALAFWLVISGFRYVDASIGSLIGLSEILFAVLFGALIFHESLTWNILAAGTLIIFAAMLPDLLNIVKGKRTSESVEPVREL